ncbi:MAG TPA: MFS transporter [Candidatus Binatia bacterium]|nr:MFS transporter [Candidatus Binatia bacterium]
MRRRPALARLLAGEFISGTGDWLYLVAVLVVVYADSSSAVLLGIVGAARILPYVLLSVPAGIVADRFDRRMVLLVTDVARGVLMLGLVAAAILDAPTLVIVAISILAACFSTFFNPAIAALIPTLVDERDLGVANSAWATLDNLAFIIGPALAGILLAAGGLEIAFLLNAISFAVVAVVLWHLPAQRAAAPVDAPEDGPAPSATGWRQLVRPLAGPFLLDSASSLVGGGIGVLTVVIAIDVLGAGEAGTGYLNAAIGVGGVVAGIAGGALLVRRLSVPLLLGGIAAGAGLAWLGLTGDLPTAMLAIGVAISGMFLLDVVSTTLVQRAVPDALRGRAIGTLQTSSSVLYALGAFSMPLLAAAVGIPAVLIGGGIVMVAGAVLALLLSERAVDDPAGADAVRVRLLDQPIFAGLPPSRLEGAARRLVAVPVEAGEVIVRQGHAADRFYVIDSGQVRVTQATDGEERALRELGPGDFFGEIGLLRGIPRTATVTATTPGVLYAIDADAFGELVGSGPGLGSRLLDLYRGAASR